MDKYKLVMVNYLNSKPFEYGLKNCQDADQFIIKTATPSVCASDFISGEADIALIPVGALHDLKDYKIISDYCIGCDGEVRTVCIFSNEKIEHCKQLLLDNHSRTSFLLSRVIMTSFFKLSLPFSPLAIDQYIHQKGDAVLMIGDKVFEHEHNFAFKYDLGSIWKEWTGLPFVFAVWVAKKGVHSDVEKILNQAFKLGIDHLPQIIKSESGDNLDLFYYFSHNIQYLLDDLKRQALALFLQKSDQILQSEKVSF